jgi:hypothetical protein
MATTNGQGGVAGLWRTLGDYGQRRYAGSSASTPLRVTEVQRDSNEAIVQVFGTIDGVGRFAVPLRGAEAAVGDTLLVAYPRDAPVGADLTYVRHLAAAAGGGIVAVDPNLPVPVFDDPFYTTQMDVNYGGAVARATIYWLAVEEKFRPTGYTISYNINAYSDGTWVRGTWIDQYVPHLGGAQSAQLSASIPPGNQVEVRLRARYAWAAAESLETETRAFLGAVDTTPVVPAVGLTIDNSVPNSLLLTDERRAVVADR